MKHILQVLRFEYIGCIKTKSFIISTVIFMVLILLMGFLPGIILSAQGGNNGNQDIDIPLPGGEKPVFAITNNAYQNSEALQKEFAMQYPGYEIKMTTEGLEELKTKVDSGAYVYALLLNEPLSGIYVTQTNSLMTASNDQLKEMLRNIYQTTALEKAGLSEELSLQIVNVPQATLMTVTTGVDQTKNYWSTYILMMLLYMAIIMYGQMVSQSVVAEKNTRAMEMLITCAKPTHPMFGKVIGSGLAGLTQMLLITSTALVSMNLISAETLPAEIKEMLTLSPRTILFALLFFLLGYFIYSFLLGALSSLASRSEDLNTLISPVMMILALSFIVIMMAMTSDNVNSPLMIACSHIPFTAPLAMFTRIAMAEVAVWEILLSVAIQLVSIYLFGRLAAAIYRIGVLMYGNPPKPAEIIKMLQEQHRTNKAIKDSRSS